MSNTLTSQTAIPSLNKVLGGDAKRKNAKSIKSKKIVFNKNDLHIDKHNTLIIIDWDDTLYPTSWMAENNVDITNPKSRYKYIQYFEKLDEHLSLLLDHTKTLGDVIIITNALPEWVDLSVSVLPKTRRSLVGIDIVSARKMYQHKRKMTDWKKLTFLDVITYKSKKRQYHNILSLGDADFEYNALLNLYAFDALPHKYLKAIRFMKSSDYNVLIEQINMMRKNILDICKLTEQVDLMFETKE